MKFPYAMLRDFVDTTLHADQVGDLLTMAGFELEGIEEVEGDHVLDIKVVSNRGDGLSVFGLAREVLAKDGSARPTEHFLEAVRAFAEQPDPQPGPPQVVSIETSDCTRFACQRYEGARPQSSPEWLQKRLRQSGMRPLGLVVDCTNYVMLELGQPLHMYDRDKLTGSAIVVRLAHDGEKLVTLNGVEHALKSDQMMICDSEKPVGAAGIMGGRDTEVGDDTTSMLLEAAHFLNTSVRRTRKQMGLSTEASYRFERSVDPEGVVAAIRRFGQLYAQCGGAAVQVGDVVDVYPAPPIRTSLIVRMARTVTLLGMDVGSQEARRYLEALGFEVEERGQDPVSKHIEFAVTAPTWRPDIVREDDVIEEIGRVHGFDRIPETLPHGATTRGGQSAIEDAIDLIREKLLRSGFHQIISHTLRDAHPLDGDGERVGPRNPGSPELALLRNSTWPSLAEAASRNGGKNIHLFETGRVFDPVLGERRMLGIYSHGALYPSHRQNESSPTADFFSLKGVCASLCPDLSLRAGSDPRLHPTRQAASDLGVIGEIHPDVAEVAGVPTGAVLLEFDLEKLAESSLGAIRYTPISRNPSVRRDIAFLVDKELPYERISNALETACGDLLERHWLFDVYEGKGVPEGQHSLAVALQLRKMGENFTDEEANQVRERAVSALVSLGASPRV